MSNEDRDMEYLFVRKGGGWWLKINSIEQFADYCEKTDSRWANEFHNLINSKEFTGHGVNHASEIAYNIGMYGAIRKMTPIEATMNFRNEVLRNQLSALMQYGEIYINSKGGYHFKTGDEDYTQFVRRKKLVFPNYSKNDIRVKQFPGGTHFYAYIGDMEVRDGDVLKWDDYESAYKKAVELVSS